MKYLLKKDGLYYRPESCGYTRFAFMAGLFDEDYAKSHASCTHGEVKAVPISQLDPVEISELKDVIQNAAAVFEAYKEVDQGA